MQPTMLNRVLAEAFGTFCLVLAGTCAIVVNNASGGTVGHVGIALTFGLVVGAMVYALGDISGCHINPAVTVAFWIAGRFPGKRVGPYVAGQVVGAILASLVVLALFTKVNGLGATVPSGPAWRSAAMEFLLTLILMFVILRVSCGAKEKGITAGLAVGSAIALDALFGGPVSGASMNPARSLAPALVGMQFNDLWVYFAGPMLGAAAAVPLHRLVAGPDANWTPEACQK